MCSCDRPATARVNVALVFILASALWCFAVPRACLAATVEGKRCVVEYSGVLVDYAKAIAAIYDCACDGYKEIFGLDLPKSVTITVSTGAPETRLWNDGDRHIYLQLASDRDLNPDSGYFHIYGMCHEPGHIAMYSKLETVAGLPDGVGEGWAHYCGSLVLDYVFAKLGQNAWPVPHDYSWQGKARLIKGCGASEKDAMMTAACAFYAIGEKYGHDKVGYAMRSALNRKPKGTELMGLFAKAIDAVTNRKGSALIPDSVRRGKVVVEKPTVVLPGRAAPSGAVLYDDGWIGYDDDGEDGMRSIAGSGHAVEFHVKRGGTLKAVKLKGSRYGYPQSDSKFEIYIMDNQFNVIDSASLPFMEFAQRGQQLYWREFNLKGIKVPEDFIVLFSFDPTATDGVYVGYDANAHGHSYTALPAGHAKQFSEGDWMIRVKVE